MIVVDKRKDPAMKGKVGIMTAGSSDIAVAEEAKAVAEAMGCQVFTEYDIGVAALHRMLDPLYAHARARGRRAHRLCRYGRGAADRRVRTDRRPGHRRPDIGRVWFRGKGEAALMGMLQTCSPGLVVVNIDNGIAAGATAALISLRARRSKD